MKTEYIIHNISESIGTEESSKVYMSVAIDTGKAELVISKTITERHPVTDYHKVMQLYESINRGGGRKVFKLKDFNKNG